MEIDDPGIMTSFINYKNFQFSPSKLKLDGEANIRIPIYYDKTEGLIFSDFVKNTCHISNFYSFIKRIMDVVVSLAVLLISLPITFLLALLIKITSKGPVFYIQERIGKNGKSFYLCKFRSMINNAESQGPQLTYMNDSRITYIGKFMRRYKLDEIPNFINVLLGDMSLVGYRPERPFYIELIEDYTGNYHRLLQIKPGVTSIGQVKYGYASSVDEMVVRLQYDLNYMQKITFLQDLKILYRTFGIIFLGNKPHHQV